MKRSIVVLGAAALVGALASFPRPAAHAQDGAKPDAKDDDKAFGDGLCELFPSWTTGLGWEVEAHPLVFSMAKRAGANEGLRRDEKKKIRVKLVVRGVKEVDGVECHELVATSDHRPDDETTLLIRRQDHSLRELRTLNKPSGAETVVKNDHAPFVLLETSSLCPWDLPLFPRETKDEEKTFDLGEGRKIVQKVHVKKAEGEIEVELRTEWQGKALVSTQLWKKGLPFWSKAVRTLDGKVDETAELDEKSVAKPK